MPLAFCLRPIRQVKNGFSLSNLALHISKWAISVRNQVWINGLNFRLRTDHAFTVKLGPGLAGSNGSEWRAFGPCDALRSARNGLKEAVAKARQWRLAAGHRRGGRASVPGTRLWLRQHGRTGRSRGRGSADALQPVLKQGGDLPGNAPQGVGSARGRVSTGRRNPRRCRGRVASGRAHDSGAPQASGISRLPSHGGGQLPPVSLDRRGVRHGHGSPDRAARALSRPSDGVGYPGLPQSNACGSPVHRDDQRAIPVAPDDGPRRPIRLDEDATRGRSSSPMPLSTSIRRWKKSATSS